MNETDDKPPFWGLDDHMRQLVERVGFPAIEADDPSEEEVYAIMRAGKCMTCESDLERNSNFIINRYGIVAAYCCGQCHSDMAVMGFLQEQHHDILTAVKFRGGFPADDTPDTPEEESETPE